MPPIDKAGRAIAGLIGHNPGPGLYSRMTRAVEQMPAVIRTQELPGLLRKYPEGVPGWEVNAVAPSLEGVQSISRQDLLDLIQQHSPAYTHREKMLGGDDQSRSRLPYVSLGESTPSARPIFEDYGQGGKDYREVLILQPGAVGENYGSHWNGVFGANNAVAHARYDTHGDALRINELQSDLGIHNRKQREMRLEGKPDARGEGLPFPLEDAWADILIKRLALEAARGGHRAIEVASPRAIADKVGGNIDNYEHFYGKVVPGAIERLGRKMGGVTPVSQPAPAPELTPLEGWRDEVLGVERDVSNEVPARARDYFNDLVTAMVYGDNATVNWRAKQVADAVAAAGITDPSAMPRIMHLAHRSRQVLDANMNATRAFLTLTDLPPARRYLMSDEMRRRILQQGIGMSVLGGLAAEEEE